MLDKMGSEYMRGRGGREGRGRESGIWNRKLKKRLRYLGLIVKRDEDSIIEKVRQLFVRTKGVKVGQCNKGSKEVRDRRERC